MTPGGGRLRIRRICTEGTGTETETGTETQRTSPHGAPTTRAAGTSTCHHRASALTMAPQQAPQLSAATLAASRNRRRGIMRRSK